MKGLLSEAKKALVKGLEYELNHSRRPFPSGCPFGRRTKGRRKRDILGRIYAKDGEIARVWAENDPAFHRFKTNALAQHIFRFRPQRKKQNENQEA